MNKPAVIMVLALCFLVTLSGPLSAGDEKEPIDEFAGIELTPIEPEAIDGQALLDSLGGRLVSDNIAGLVESIEGCLPPIDKKLTSGTANKLGKDIVTQVRQQSEIWWMAWRQAHCSTRADEPLCTMTDEDFVESASLDGPAFQDLFKGVIEGDVSMENQKPGDVDPNTYFHVLQVYSLLENDVDQYNSLTCLLADDGQFPVVGEVKASKDLPEYGTLQEYTGEIVSRLRTRLQTLRELFIES